MAVENPDDLHGKDTENKVKWGCALVAEKQKSKVPIQCGSELFVCVAKILLKLY